MNLRVRANQDLLSGLLFAGFGAMTLIIASGYPIGSAQRMGPGYLPLVLGGLLLLLGFALVIRGLRTEGVTVHVRTFRPIALILASVVAFSFLVELAGLVLAIIATVTISRLAGDQTKVAEIVIICLAMIVLCASVFVLGLGMNLPLWPRI